MITSKDNDLIKLCNKIKQKKHSREERLCLVETIKLVNQLYLKGKLTHILVTSEKYDLVRNYNKCEIIIVSDSIADYLSEAKTTDGVFGICKIIDNTNYDYSRCLVLDRLQDPSNLGAIIRSAHAFGYNTIFAIDSVYPYTYKSIRSSMGYVFDINYIDTNLDGLLEYKEKYNISLVSADMSGEIVDDFEPKSDNIAIVIGNEGKGVSRELMNLSDNTIRIPMGDDVESLNASVSAGIIMYLLK
ncbi:MAG: RNA methyltransferase [Clostridiales bacterium]|nr:RNA methyltransferase [Clostridiales bacterium]